MDLKVNSAQPNFRARLHLGGVRLKPKEYSNLARYVKNIGDEYDSITIDQKFIDTYTNKEFKTHYMNDILAIAPEQRVQKIKEKIKSILRITSASTAVNAINESENNTENLQIENEYQKIVKKSEKVLEAIEQIKLPTRVKLYEIGKEPIMKISNLTKEGFQARRGNSTYFYKVVGGKIDEYSVDWELYENDYEMKPSQLCPSSKFAKIILDKIQVGEHTLQMKYDWRNEPELLEQDTKLPESFNNANLRIRYKWNKEPSSYEYEDSYLVARPVIGSANLPEHVVLHFSEGKLDGVKTEHPITKGNITVTARELAETKISKTEKVNVPFSYYKQPFITLVECLKEKIGNKEFTTDVNEKRYDIDLKWDPIRELWYRYNCVTNKIIDKVLNPKHEITLDKQGGYFALKNPVRKVHYGHYVPSGEPYVPWDFVADCVSYYDFGIGGNYINNHQIKFGPPENDRNCILDKDEGFIYDRKDQSITAIKYRGKSVMKETLPYRNGGYSDYVDFKLYDSQSECCFSGYYQGNKICGTISKDGNKILAMSIAKFIQCENGNHKVQYSITKYPNSDDIILSSDGSDEDVIIKADSIEELEKIIKNH